MASRYVMLMAGRRQKAEDRVKRVQLGTVLEPPIRPREDWHLERCQNPQAGKPALRGADILVCGFWGLSSPQLRTVSSCTRMKKQILRATWQCFLILHSWFISPAPRSNVRLKSRASPRQTDRARVRAGPGQRLPRFRGPLRRAMRSTPRRPPIFGGADVPRRLSNNHARPATPLISDQYNWHRRVRRDRKGGA